MLEKLKKNYNEWYSHSLGMVILAICVVLNGHTEISFALYGLAMILLGVGTLYNQQKQLIKQGEELISLRNQFMEELEQIKREQEIYNRLKEYEEKGDSILVSKEDAIAGLSKE